MHPLGADAPTEGGGAAYHLGTPPLSSSREDPMSETTMPLTPDPAAADPAHGSDAAASPADPVPTAPHRAMAPSDAQDTFVADTPARRVDVTGADRARYLDDVTSQSLSDVATGTVHSTMYLDQHGAPIAMFDVAALADRFALLTPDQDVADTVVEVLGGRTFLLDARFEPTDHVVLALRGATAAEVADGANLATRPGTVRPAGAELFVIGRDHGCLDIVGPPSAIDDARDLLVDAGARIGDVHDLEAWRVSSGVPAWGVEVTAPHLPEELGLLTSHVHLGKGCYPGQEAVARMWMLGRPRRRLAVVTADGAVLAPGWEAGAGRKRVTVTTVGPDGSRGLAFVPGDAVVGDRFTAESGGTIEVVALVGDDDDPPGHDPAMTRRRDRRA